MSVAKPRVLLSAGMIQGGLSGVGRYVVELAKRLGREEAIELHVAGLESDRPLFPSIREERWVEIPAAYGSGVKSLLWHQLKLPRLLRRGGYHLLHIPSYRRIVAFSDVPQIATIHDCAPFRLRDKYGALRGLFGRRLAPWLARRCTQVLTVSEFTKQDLVEFFGLSAEGVEVIYNGLDHKAYQEANRESHAAFRKRHGLERPFLLYISRLEHPGKNHLRLIEAYEHFRRLSGSDALLVLGGAPWHGAEVIRERAQTSPYGADIRMPGFMEESDLPRWYASAQALVFPSLIEGFGLPVVEAMACGQVVASSNWGSLPEVGGDAAVYFDPTDPEAMARAIQTLADESPEARARRIQNGYTQAARFDWDIAAKATCQIYLKTISLSDHAS